MGVVLEYPQVLQDLVGTDSSNGKILWKKLSRVEEKDGNSAPRA